MNRNAIVCLAVMLAASAGFCQEAKPGVQALAGQEAMYMDGQCTPDREQMQMRGKMQQGMQQPGMMRPMMGKNMPQQPGMMRPMMGKNMPQQQGMMGHGMDRGMMRQGMQGQMQTKPQASMVPSDNGGIIVLRGNTLYKFDKNLNLLREAVLPRPEKEIEKKPPVKDKE
ncbi:MAG: hypothetical protein JW957_02305 [Candidatus Omnitrophica bacterium]|nr:hypothetical protein [Candidatus Omnitrophota bacterium]